MWNPFKPRIRLGWLQIQISSACNASCSYCPRTAYRKNWKNQFFPPELLENILPFLHPGTYIHLQGWGEPFLHPRLFAIIETIKKQGFRVGTTTNGALLNTGRIEHLMDLGLDMLAFSIAGCGSHENDGIRKGASLRQVIQIIEKIQALRESKQSPFPRIHLAQMMLRSSLEHINTYPAFWKNLGVEQVVLSSLSLVTRPEFRDEARLADSMEEWDELKSALYEMRKNNGLGDILRFHLVSPFLFFKGCSENIHESAVVDCDGRVSPCVMASLPVSGPVTHWSYGAAHAHSNLSWGSVRENTFDTIWRYKKYRSFRKQEEMTGQQCHNCLKRCVETMDTAYQLDPSSMTCRWQVIKEANEEIQAARRMKKRRGKDRDP